MTVVAGEEFAMTGVGFTPNASIKVEFHGSSGCPGARSLFNRTADAEGNLTVLQWAGARSETISFLFVDPERGASNCLDIEKVAATPTEPPVATEVPGTTETPAPTEDATPTVDQTEVPGSEVPTDEVTPEPTQDCNVTVGQSLAFAQVDPCETPDASPVPVDPTVAATTPVVLLPSTGTGDRSAVPQFFQILVLSAAMIAIGTIGWSRRTRWPRRKGGRDRKIPPSSL